MNRRSFLRNVAATSVGLLLPRRIGGGVDCEFWFLATDTGASWPVRDPVVWSLDNARQPVMERAAERLLLLTPSAGDRVIRLVTRRCELNLIEIRPRQVVAHHWGRHGQADLRPFFTTRGLAHSEIEVVLRDRKKEQAVVRPGDDFLYGDRLTADFPLGRYLDRWTSRFAPQPDDWTAAPGTCSGYAWAGVEDDRIPWAALKSAWRRAGFSFCPNCRQPMILVNFGRPWTSMFNRSPRFVLSCFACCRSFSDELVTDAEAWIAAHLDAEVWPQFDMVLGRRVRRYGPGLR